MKCSPKRLPPPARPYANLSGIISPADIQFIQWALQCVQIICWNYASFSRLDTGLVKALGEHPNYG